MHPTVLAPDLDPTRATVDEPSDIRLVLQQASDADRVPVTTIERGDAFPIQLSSDPLKAPHLGVPHEDASDDLALERLNFALAGGQIVHVTIAAPAEGLRDTTRACAFQLAARRPLDDLLALDLGGERAQGHHELAER